MFLSPYYKMLPFDHIVSQFLYSVGGAVQTIILKTF